MKKATKTTARFAALALTAALLISTLPGCGDSSSGNVSSASGVSQNGETPAAELKELSMLAMDPGNQYVKWKDRDEYSVWHEVEALLTNAGITVDVELVSQEQYEVVVQTRMAAASNLPDIADISPLDAAAVLKLGQRGIVQPLTGLIEQYSNGNIAKTYEEKFASAYPLTKTEDGELYWFSNLLLTTYAEQGGIPEGVGETIQVRRDWLDKLGLSVPSTVEEFKNMLVQFQEQDANGNGQKDEIYLLNSSSFANGLAQAFGLGNSYISVDPVNRKVVSPWYQEGVRDYFNYVRELISLGVVDTATMGNSDLAIQRKAENKVSASFDYGMGAWLENEVQNTEGVMFQPLHPLKALDNVTPYAIKEPADLVWQKYVITQNCKDTAAAIAFFDVMCSDEYFDLVNYGIEGETYDVVDGEKVLRNLGSWEEQANARTTTFQSFNPFPRAMMRLLDDQIDACLAQENTKYKGEYQKEAAGYEPWYPDVITNHLAMATEEESKIINDLTNDIKTYSEELATQLSLGTLSLEDWDSYMGEFDKLQLPKLIEVYQQRMDRFYQLQS